MKKQVWQLMNPKEKILALFNKKKYLEYERKYGWSSN
jgi:hypothetical protein